MDKEELKEQVKKILENLGATEIQLSDVEPNKVIVTFNWENVISFKASLPGWTYTGIQLDPTNGRKYKIEFSRESTNPTP